LDVGVGGSICKLVQALLRGELQRSHWETRFRKSEWQLLFGDRAIVSEEEVSKIEWQRNTQARNIDVDGTTSSLRSYVQVFNVKANIAEYIDANVKRIWVAELLLPDDDVVYLQLDVHSRNRRIPG